MHSTPHLSLLDCSPADLPAIFQLEQAPDTEAFIYGYSVEAHQALFAAPNAVYLKVCRHSRLVGFVILVTDRSNVEFRRIVVAPNARGIGQQVIKLMESYCLSKLGCTRIWLDVFSTNRRAIYVYEKLGYQRFEAPIAADADLLFYEKRLG